MFLAVVLTLLVAGCSYSNSQDIECAKGLYYDDISDDCVSECPCGSIGDSSNQRCINVTYYYYYQVGFNQTRYRFSVPADAPPGTKVGTGWITMPLSLVTLEDGTFAPFQLNYIYEYFYDFVLTSEGIRRTLSQEPFDVEVYFANHPEDAFEPEGSGDVSLLNFIPLDDLKFCGNEHILIPVDIYTQSEVFGIGTYVLDAGISFLINDRYVYAYEDFIVDVNSDCGSAEYYLSSTGQCVSECPCGTTPYPGFCYEESDALITGIPEATHTEINPQTPQGTKIYSYNLFLNITDGSHLKEFDGNSTISWYIYYRATYHGGNASTFEYLDVMDHYYDPQFGIKVPGMEVSAFIDLTGPIEELFPVSNPEIEECSWGSSTFIKVPVDVFLVSPYVYHLGTSFLGSNIYFYLENYGQSTYLSNRLRVETNADCPSHLHYDFDSGSCVSKCPCGFIGYDYHTPHYCEPAPEGPYYYGYYYYYYQYFYTYARFSETNYLLELPWDSPPKVETFEVSVFVYPDLTDFLEYYSTVNDTIILAHVELLYIGSNYTTAGQGYGIDVPMVTLTGPTLSESENGISLNTTGDRLDFILRNSSQYGLEYCYDDLQDRVIGYIPITVTVTSPRQYSLLANHSFSLFMTFSSPNDIFLHYDLQYAYDTFNITISITPGDIGQTPRPPLNLSLEEGKDFYPFIDVKSFKYSELERSSDGTSEIISIPIGLPFGNSIQTKAFVGTNGIISFEREWHFWSPTRFPTSGFWTRNGFVVAPFWNDHDLRKSGSIRYAVIDSDVDRESQDLLKNISKFLQLHHEQAAMDEFDGAWMLLAHWDGVHPYPHGSYDSYYNSYYSDYVNKQNSYQAIVITDGADSYALFTYNCEQMEWTGYWQHGVVGYNAKGDYYENHPASGFEVVGTAVACANDLYGTPWNNLVFKTSLSRDFKLNAKKECRDTYRLDNQRIQTPISEIEMSLEPCPCTLWQAQRDWARFSWDWNNYLCYVQRFPVEVAVEEGTAYFTQQCCYSPSGSDDFGALISVGQYSGSMLSYHPINNYVEYLTYDKQFRDACCGVAQMCSLYFGRRPSQNCSGYEPPTWTWGNGDPHITTLDGRSYTFNGWGEYVLLEYVPQGSSSATFVMQARTTSVDEANSNAATQFSAFAFGLPGELSFQIGVKEGSLYVYKTSGTQEDISSSLANVNDTYNNTNGKAELVRQAQDSLLAVFSNGVGITINVTAGIPNFVLALPSSFKTQTRGLLGNYNGDEMDDFIPRNQDNALSDSISDQDIHEMFGQTWAIAEAESLFSYSLGGSTSFASFQYPDHQPAFLDQLTLTEEQMELCGSNKECAFDYAQTGDIEIGLATMNTKESNSMDQTLLANFPPNMTGESVLRVTVGEQAQYTFTVTDPGDTFIVGVLGGLPAFSDLIDNGDGSFTFVWTVQQPTNISLNFFARDSLNASSVLSPRVEVCACANGGECTLDGLLSTDDSSIIMNCLCTEAFDGEFCEEDRNGCLDVVCYEGVDCLDVPAPGLGADCGPCPPGLTGNGSKCFDINECAVDPTICEQQCVNTEGSYNCTCWQGYQMDQEGLCQDVDECSGVNDCQQECKNIPGSYDCSCYDGFELSSDEKSCNVLTTCSASNDCSHVCAIVDGTPTCFCNLGYELALESKAQCVDKDECILYSPCDQECTNLPGSFECSCNAGYELHEDGITCIDVDECLEAAIYNIELCSQNTVCANTGGAYECPCLAGFKLINGTCQREVEAPPPVEQVAPPNAEANRLQVVITGLVPDTFTAERKQSFKEVTAELVNVYCSVNDCGQIYMNSKKRSQAVMVEPKHVALQSISEDSEGRLVFYVYIQLEQGILTQEVLQNALQGSEELYINRVDGVTAIRFFAVSTSSTTSPSPTPPTMEDETPMVIIIIVVLATVVLLVVVAVVVCAAVSFVHHKKKQYSGKEGAGVFPLVETGDDDKKPLEIKDESLAEKAEMY